MTAVIFSSDFIPPPELTNYLMSIGYIEPQFYQNWELAFNPLVVDFIKLRLKTHFNNDRYYEGREDCRYMCGHAGSAHVLDIDTTKPWVITYDNQGRPHINYVEIDINEYGLLTLKGVRQWFRT